MKHMQLSQKEIQREGAERKAKRGPWVTITRPRVERVLEQVCVCECVWERERDTVCETETVVISLVWDSSGNKNIKCNARPTHHYTLQYIKHKETGNNEVSKIKKVWFGCDYNYSKLVYHSPECCNLPIKKETYKPDPKK